jgi:anti-anti-sigma regulatory factor
MAQAAVRTAGAERLDHVCWVYDDPVDFHQRATAFLIDGLAAGERVEYVGSDSFDDLHRQLGVVDGLDELISAGQLVVRSLSGIYGDDAVVVPTEPVAAYAAATQAALAEGFSGYRVVAEATSLVRSPEQRDAFARYEHLIDRYMAHNPFSALCGYDARILGRDGAAHIACLHPHANAGAAPFHWSATTRADVRLAGEIDLAAHDLFDATVSRTIPLVPGDDVVVDGAGLDFIDHRGLLALDTHARTAGRRVTLMTDLSIVHRLTEILALRWVRTQGVS